MRLLLLFLFCSLSLPLFAQKKPMKGYKAYSGGEFWYKLHTKNKRQAKPKEGDQVQIDYTLGKGAEVYKRSHGEVHPTFVLMPAPGFDNFFTHALSLMGVGDSLEVLVCADSIPEYLGEYQPHFQRSDWVRFTYKMQAIKPAAIYQAERRREQQRADSIRNATYQWVRSYQRDSAASLAGWQSLDETNLYYKIHQPGNARNACSGGVVQLHIMGFLTDGSILYDSFEAMQLHDWTPQSFSLIYGIEACICLLNEGASAWLHIPPDMAYGAQGVKDQVPPNATVIFYIEIAKVL